MAPWHAGGTGRWGAATAADSVDVECLQPRADEDSIACKTCGLAGGSCGCLPLCNPRAPGRLEDDKTHPLDLVHLDAHGVARIGALLRTDLEGVEGRVEKNAGLEL